MNTSIKHANARDRKRLERPPKRARESRLERARGQVAAGGASLSTATPGPTSGLRLVRRVVLLPRAVQVGVVRGHVSSPTAAYVKAVPYTAERGLNVEGLNADPIKQDRRIVLLAELDAHRESSLLTNQ